MKKITVLLPFLLIMACSAAPKQSSYPLNYQQKMQASYHWKLLAEKVARDITTKHIYPPACKPPSEYSPNIEYAFSDRDKFVSENKVFVSASDRSPFGNAIRTLLITEFENQKPQGISTSFEKALSRYQVDWEVQKVFHQANRDSRSGLPVALLETVQAILIGESDSDSQKPHSEIIVTFNVYKGESQDPQSRIMRETYIFYVNDMDADHYYNYQNYASEDNLEPVNYIVKNDPKAGIKCEE